MGNNNTQAKPGKADDTQCAFFYGTLMVPEIFYSVCYGNQKVPDHIASRHTFTPAILHGYCRRRVAGVDYPGITPDDSKTVLGAFATGLSEDNIAKLDIFEGCQYERKAVKVKLLTHVGNAKGEGNVEGEERSAEVYVFQDPEELENEEWDLEQFRREKLHIWTRSGYVFEDTAEKERAYVASENPRW